MSAIFTRLAIGLHDHGHRIPADVGLDAALERPIARIGRLLPHRDGIDIGRIGPERQIAAGAARMVDEALEQEVRACGALGPQHGINGFQPFARLDRVQILGAADVIHDVILVLAAAGCRPALERP